MFSLVGARNTTGEAGEPLPTVFPRLAGNTVHFRRGQYHLIAAAPGVGKSLLSLSLAVQAKVPTFYFSADSDAFTMYVRTAARETGWLTTEVEAQLASKNTQFIDATVNAATRHLRWCFDTNPDCDTVEEELRAYATVYGCYPSLIVMDNITNLWTESGEGQAGTEAACDYLHALARKTGAAVVGLHHVTGEFDDGTRPVPLSGLKGKVSKVPECVLTLFRDPAVPNAMGIAVVKNRTGRADPSAAMIVTLGCELERMRLT